MTLRPLLAALPAVLVSFALAACGGGGSGPGTADVTLPPAGALTLSAVLPPGADLGGGLAVSLTGSGFPQGQGPVYVHFGGRVVEAQVLSDTLLQTSVPPGDAVGPVDVRVATATGLAALPQGFAYLPPPPPVPVLTCVPAVGSFTTGLGGTLIELQVEHLAPLTAPSVTFGGVPGTGLVVLGPDRVRVAVPSGLPAGQMVPVVLSQGAEQATNTAFWHQGGVAARSLMINEFLPNPGTLDANRDGTVSSTGDEFVELVNRLGIAVDLSYWTLSDGTGVRHTFPNPTTVPAGGSLVVFGGGNPTFFASRHASGHAQLAATGDLGLNNSADSITLRAPDTTVVAQTSYATADVSAGRSRTAVPDGQNLPVPAGSVDYVFHDVAPGAVGTASPGVKADGSAFP